MHMIARDEYLQKLIDLRDTDLIKVVTGIRRCGKSTLFKLYQDYLKSNGVSNEQIISINFEDLAYEELLNYRSIYDHVKSRLISEKMNYVFLDEIQAVDQFQKAADSLYIQDNVDLYITGSNASLLSGDLATLLSGRYVEIAMMPLSFKEYVSAQTDKSSHFRIVFKISQKQFFSWCDRNLQPRQTAGISFRNIQYYSAERYCREIQYSRRINAGQHHPLYV